MTSKGEQKHADLLPDAFARLQAQEGQDPKNSYLAGYHDGCNDTRKQNTRKADCHEELMSAAKKVRAHCDANAGIGAYNALQELDKALAPRY